METLMEKIIWAWNDLDPLLVAGIFVAYFIYDVLYAYFTISVQNLKAGRAATFSSLLYIIGTAGVLSYVENFLYTIPIIIGGWLGTYAAVVREKKIKDRELHVPKVPHNK